jgi:hypothetical protein
MDDPNRWQKERELLHTQSSQILDAYFSKGCPCKDEQFSCFVQKLQGIDPDTGEGSEDGFQVIFIDTLLSDPRYVLDRQSSDLPEKVQAILTARFEQFMQFATCSVCDEKWAHVSNEWHMGATGFRLMPCAQQEPRDPKEAGVRYAELAVRGDLPWKMHLSAAVEG